MERFIAIGRKSLIGVALGALGFALSSPAAADTKAGVDAWSRGDSVAAVQAWQVAAEQGDADALFNLGQAYKLGRGVEQDLARAEIYYKQALAKGHLLAADNYGLLLFQRGAHEQALPYLQAATERGDPRAQYLLGLAHFNGGLLPKDWVRAYALISLSNQQGLQPARAALIQMDQHIPLAQRQQGVALAAQLDDLAQAKRAQQLAALDLDDMAANTQPAPPAPTAHNKPPVATRPAASARAATTGPWRIQLGAFRQAANADALWSRVKGRAELAGHPRRDVPAGKVSKLQASGFPSRAAAADACARLTAAGFTCIPAAE